jgi:hypothetical protein
MSHRLMHWRSVPAPYNDPGGARFALSLGTAVDEYEEPYIPRDALPFPSIDLRKALVAGQQLRYSHRLVEALDVATASNYMRMFVPMREAFSPSYGNGVCTIFAESFLGGDQALIQEYYGAKTGCQQHSL